MSDGEQQQEHGLEVYLLGYVLDRPAPQEVFA